MANELIVEQICWLDGIYGPKTSIGIGNLYYAFEGELQSRLEVEDVVHDIALNEQNYVGYTKDNDIGHHHEVILYTNMVTIKEYKIH